VFVGGGGGVCVGVGGWGGVGGGCVEVCLVEMTFNFCVVRLIHMCGMTLSYLWHGSFICVT